jgi:beta-glucosidase
MAGRVSPDQWLRRIFTMGQIVVIWVLFLVARPAHPQQFPTPAASATKVIYHDGWIDLNKNGRKDPYEDPSLDIEKRIDDLLGRMTLEEKSCQLATLYGYKRVLQDPLPTPEWKEQIWKDGIANIDEHCNGVRGVGRQCALPPSRHAEVINAVQKFFIEETRLGIPIDFTNEGIRGLCHWGATSFPASIGIGCTWDPELVREIGRVTGREARAVGYTNIYAPILDLARDPRWGRVVETYTEDPYLGSVLGVEMVKGLQSENVTSTPKHFAVYSVPKGGRDGEARTDPHESPHEVENILLAPFRAAFVKGGALGTMSSYNDYDGVPITASRHFLIDKLRGEYGFKGYVVSDSDAVKFIWSKHHLAKDYKDAIRLAINAGLNVRTEFNPPQNFIGPLRELVKEGAITQETLDSRVRDVLRVKMIRGLFDHPYVGHPADADQILRTPEHLELSKRASRESLVLLKNDGNVLPLSKQLRSILVVGPNADAKEFANNRYGPYDPPTVSVLDGIRRTVSPATQVKYALGCELVDPNWPDSELVPRPMSTKETALIDQARNMAKQVDTVVAVVGESESIVGEGFSRTSLDLPGRQLDLIRALYKTGKPIIVVLINGRALTINWVARNVPAILEATFPGEFGGLAIAEALFGDYNPGGKLSFTVPKSVGQLPMNFPTKPGAQAEERKGGPNNKTTLANGVLYPFGFGLSYTTFAYNNLQISPQRQKAGNTFSISVDISNTGTRTGDEVVQLYLHDLLSSVITYEQLLRGFKRIRLVPGEKRTVSFTLTDEDLQLLNADMRWAVEPGEFEVQVGSSSADIRLKGRFEVQP